MTSSTTSTNAYICPVDPLNLEKLRFDSEAAWSSEAVKQLNTCRVVHGEQHVAALVSLGDKFSGLANSHLKAEKYRQAVAVGVHKLVGSGSGNLSDVQVTVGRYPRAAAVGTHLASFDFTLKTKRDSATIGGFQPAHDVELNAEDLQEWNLGVHYAESQNLARELMELPGNLMTPTAFCKRIQKEFSEVSDTEVIVRDREWAESHGMSSFLSVARGSSEPLKFLEIHYNGSEKGEIPVAFVGKGITFDTGGISLKPATGMKLMRGDMGGAATVAAAALAISKLQLPMNLIVTIPLCENLPGPSANKPGDVVYAMNGKSIEIDNTDAEGRLILADALHYTNITYKPHTIIDVATLTGAMEIALGNVFTGVFSTSDSLWEELHEAGEVEYDRFWRMPLDEEFGPQIYSSSADLCNTGGKPGGSCTAALFLKAFVDHCEVQPNRKDIVRWAHLDIAGTMEATRDGAYQRKGMTGRSTRGLIEWARRYSLGTI